MCYRKFNTNRSFTITASKQAKSARYYPVWLVLTKICGGRRILQKIDRIIWSDHARADFIRVLIIKLQILVSTVQNWIRLTIASRYF